MLGFARFFAERAKARAEGLFCFFAVGFDADEADIGSAKVKFRLQKQSCYWLRINILCKPGYGVL